MPEADDMQSPIDQALLRLLLLLIYVPLRVAVNAEERKGLAETIQSEPLLSAVVL